MVSTTTQIVLINWVKNRQSLCQRSLQNHMDYEIEAGESVSTAVVRAVSAVEGHDPCSLRPLTAVIDPDALDVLFDSRADDMDTPRTGGHLSFIYSHCRVTVDNGEYLTVQLLENSPRIRRQESEFRRAG